MPALMASSLETMPTPWVRAIRISLVVSRLSNSSRKRGKAVDDLLASASSQPAGRSHAAAAEAHVVAHHARAGEGFEEVENLLALAEGVHQRRAAGAHVLHQEADEAGVVLQAGQLAGDDAEVLGALRNLDAGELLDGERVGPVVGDGAEVVEAVGVGHGAEVGFVLGDLFVVAMQVAEDGLELDDRARRRARRPCERRRAWRGAAGPSRFRAAAPSCDRSVWRRWSAVSTDAMRSVVLIRPSLLRRWRCCLVRCSTSSWAVGSYS